MIKEVVKLIEGELWKRAMEDKITSFRKNVTWALDTFPKGRKLVNNKWVFMKKMGAIGQVKKYKDRLVAKGYSQVEGVNFGDIFSLITKLDSLRVLMSLPT